MNASGLAYRYPPMSLTLNTYQDGLGVRTIPYTCEYQTPGECPVRSCNTQPYLWFGNMARGLIYGKVVLDVLA
jgi:hypothetical protein